MSGAVSPLPPGLVADDVRVLMIVGAYGSGKTEIAVNLAIALAQSGRRVQLADLDLVNPYFRSREARRLMESHGVRVVVPPGALASADLPIVMREVPGMLQPPEGVLTLFDVGGDDVGARVLSSFRPLLHDGAYELWQVLNERRPFTSDRAGCVQAIRSIEASSRLRVTGLIANAHLIDETTADVVVSGCRLARDVAEETGLPLRCVAAMAPLAADPAVAALDAPVLRLVRHMLPPWSVRRSAATEESALPAAHPIPIGKPVAVHPANGREGAAHG